MLLAVAPSVAPAAEPASSVRPAEPTLRIEAKEGKPLSKKEEKDVRKALSDYLEALQKHDYEKAGELLDRPSLLAAVEPMVSTISSDSTHHAAALRQIFGVSTRDSIEQRSNGDLFASLMAYLTQLNPGALSVISQASIELLAARKMGDKVHIAYQLTLPPSEPNGLPYEQVTAQQMRKVDGKWRILFRLDQ